MDTGIGHTDIYIRTTRTTTGIGGITKQVAAANIHGCAPLPATLVGRQQQSRRPEEPGGFASSPIRAAMRGRHRAGVEAGNEVASFTIPPVRCAQ
jgi:hypothetical protein